VTRAQFGHQISADKTHNWHLLLGVPVVIFTTVAGTDAFAEINRETDNFWKVAAGTFGIVAAILASMQTFFGLGERSDPASDRSNPVREHQTLDRAGAHEPRCRFRPLYQGETDRTGAASPQIGKGRWEEASVLAHRDTRGVAPRGEAHRAGCGLGKHAWVVNDRW
jgi:hypothetical protein